MSNDELYKVELPAIDQLKKLNWKYIEGEKFSPNNSDERKFLFIGHVWYLIPKRCYHPYA